MQLTQYFYYVLAPSVHTGDANIDYYYDFTQSIDEYSKVFAALQLQWQWQPVTLQNYASIIATIASQKNIQAFIINLCDGDDVNDVPGVNVIHELAKHQLIYSGADAFFYNITTSKIPMKKAFDTAKVNTAAWCVVNDAAQKVFTTLRAPIIIKPAVSGGSMGISVKNVVYNNEDFLTQVNVLQKGYNGWNLMADGLFAEEFITGQEYTTFIIGNHLQPEQCIVYEPIHRVFHNSLPKEQQFLSFDRLWEIYETETAMPNNDNFYEYQKITIENLVQQLKDATIKAFVSCKGVGYARIDFRICEKTNIIYCLEVNAQCGLSEDENYTSIGAIIRVSNVSYTSVIESIIKERLNRFL
jgi:D-alanine-D-alanine ligase